MRFNSTLKSDSTAYWVEIQLHTELRFNTKLSRFNSKFKGKSTGNGREIQHQMEGRVNSKLKWESTPNWRENQHQMEVRFKKVREKGLRLKLSGNVCSNQWQPLAFDVHLIPNKDILLLILENLGEKQHHKEMRFDTLLRWDKKLILRFYSILKWKSQTK